MNILTVRQRFIVCLFSDKSTYVSCFGKKRLLNALDVNVGQISVWLYAPLFLETIPLFGPIAGTRSYGICRVFHYMSVATRTEVKNNCNHGFPGNLPFGHISQQTSH